MNKILLIVQREFLNRVQKKSFLIATIVVPLIFPSFIGLLAYISIQQNKNAKKQIIHYVDESHTFRPDTTKYIFKEFSGTLADAIEAYGNSDFGVLYIPKFELSQPVTITLRSKSNHSIEDEAQIKSILEGQIRERKIQRMHLDQRVLDSLKTDVSIKTINIAEGTEQAVNSYIIYGVGAVGGILMYMFIFIYGAQIMQGVIEEKTSKVVEVIISSVRPFQLMMGKIIGLGSVGLLQFTIWIVLVSTLTFGVLGYFGIDPPQQQALQQISSDIATQQAAMNNEVKNGLNEFMSLPFGYIVFVFIFYFIGGYLLYGAMFAAIGSAVDSPAEAQQFMFPIMIPMLISYISLFMFVLRLPDEPISFWLSIIPLTSPIAMMGRIAHGVPLWELLLSMTLLIATFVLTTWVAGRIYRVGILMHGTKINYKVMVKWFMMKG